MHTESFECPRALGGPFPASSTPWCPQAWPEVNQASRSPIKPPSHQRDTAYVFFHSRDTITEGYIWYYSEISTEPRQLFVDIWFLWSDTPNSKQSRTKKYWNWNRNRKKIVSMSNNKLKCNFNALWNVTRLQCPSTCVLCAPGPV